MDIVYMALLWTVGCDFAQWTFSIAYNQVWETLCGKHWLCSLLSRYKAAVQFLENVDIGEVKQKACGKPECMYSASFLDSS